MLIFVSTSCTDSAELAGRADAALSAIGKPPIGKIRKTDKGAPLCDNGYISVTHTDGIILLALSDKPIGIDAEKDGRTVPVSIGDIANWTAYEALCKLRGDGIRLSEIRAGGDFGKEVKFLTFLKGYTVAVAGGDDSVYVICV